MRHHAAAYTETEIRLLAEYFAEYNNLEPIIFPI